MIRHRLWRGNLLAVGLAGIALAVCSCHEERFGNRRRSSTTARPESVRPEPGLLGRRDSIGFVDLRLRTLVGLFLRFDSATGRPATSLDALMRSAFAPRPGDLVDVWGTPVQVRLYADSVVVASAGSTRSWEDSAGVRVTAYYGRTDSTAIRTRALVLNNGKTSWVEWWLP
jgi:hypothetical protein